MGCTCNITLALWQIQGLNIKQSASQTRCQALEHKTISSWPCHMIMSPLHTSIGCGLWHATCTFLCQVQPSPKDTASEMAAWSCTSWGCQGPASSIWKRVSEKLLWHPWLIHDHCWSGPHCGNAAQLHYVHFYLWVWVFKGRRSHSQSMLQWEGCISSKFLMFILLIKSVESHGRSLLLLVLKVMVRRFVSDSHEVMTALAHVVFGSKCCCGVSFAVSCCRLMNTWIHEVLWIAHRSMV